MSVGAINNIHKSTIYAFTEDGFFASFSIFQYCIPYWFYSESTTLWLVKSTGNSADLFSSDSWNLYCTHSRIWAPTWKLEVRASEIDLLFSVTLKNSMCYAFYFTTTANSQWFGNFFYKIWRHMCLYFMFLVTLFLLTLSYIVLFIWLYILCKPV